MPRQRQTVQTARFNDSLFDDGMSHYLMIMMNDNDIQRLPSVRKTFQTVRLENTLFVFNDVDDGDVDVYDGDHY